MALHAPGNKLLAENVEKSSLLNQSSSSTSTSSRELNLRKQKTGPNRINLSPGETKKKKILSSKLCMKWREIQGACNWQGLVPDSHTAQFGDEDEWDEYRSETSTNTMDEALRSEIIKYGEFAQACYDAFNNDPDSRFRGDSMFPKEQILQETTGDLINRGYQVTKYLYATARSDLPSFFARPGDRSDSWSNDSNWMGFIAVSTSQDEISRLGRRDIVVSWRGTVTGLEWMQNLHDFLQPTGLDPSDKNTTGVKVESGFLNLYTSSNPRTRHNKMSAREQLLAEIRRLVEFYRGEELSITVTGHSLGGALALISAYDIAELELNSGCGTSNARTSTTSISFQIPVSVFSFSAPRVGNRLFAKRCEELNVRTLRVVNKRDMVPKVPGVLFNEHHQELSRIVESMLPWAYTHVGVEIALDTSDSPYLRRDGDLIAQHNLEGLLHLVDGYQGPGKRFRPSGMRDVALVNKSSDLLRRECGIPPFWKGY